MSRQIVLCFLCFLYSDIVLGINKKIQQNLDELDKFEKFHVMNLK